MPKVSIVVPVYKVEPYIENCIESIIHQTYKDFELILVDDGSPDRCPQICEEYALQDSRIKVIHKENGGLSDARNVGLKNAVGEYVTYIDSDDSVHPLYIETLLKAILETKSDFAIVDFLKVYSTAEYKTINIKDIDIKKMKSKDVLALILYQKFHDVSVWGGLYPLEMAKVFTFPVGKLFEDLYTSYKFYLNAEYVAVIDAKLYYYLQRKNSIMSSELSQRYIHDMLEASDNIVCECKAFNNLLIAAENKRFSNYCSLAASDLSAETEEDKGKIKKYLYASKKNVVWDKKSRIKNRIAAAALYMGVPMLKMLYKLQNNLKMYFV